MTPLQKSRTLSLFVFYILLSATFSFIPAFAQTTDTPITDPPVTDQPPSVSDIIISLLDQSRTQVDQQIQQLESEGIEIPPDASTIFGDAIAEYQASIEALENGDFENGKEHALEAMSLFDDSMEELIDAYDEFAEQQEDLVEEFFELEETITELEIDADELRELISINNLGISLYQFDASIDLATDYLISGDLLESELKLDLADDILDDLYDQIEEDVEEEQDELLAEFVEDTIEDLDDIISNANELGLSQSIIDDLQNTVDILGNAENPEDLFDVTGETSNFNEIISEFPELIPDEEVEDDVEADFEDTIERHGEDNVEDDFEDTIERHGEDNVEEDFEDTIEDPAKDDIEDDFEDTIDDHVEDDIESDFEDNSGSGSSGSGSSDDDETDDDETDDDETDDDRSGSSSGSG